MCPVFSRPQPGFSVRFRDTISTDWLQATQRGLCLSPMRQMQEGPVVQSYSEADAVIAFIQKQLRRGANRSEEHTSELQSLMRISYAVFCLKKKKSNTNNKKTDQQQT